MRKTRRKRRNEGRKIKSEGKGGLWLEEGGGLRETVMSGEKFRVRIKVRECEGNKK